MYTCADCEGIFYGKICPCGWYPEYEKQKKAALEILEFFNSKQIQRSRNPFRSVAENINPIIDRLKSGVSIEDCKKVISIKFDQWGNNPKMCMHFCPPTIFRQKNFEKYLGEIEERVPAN
jgi:uncharacterized phage protein (TIGR02220 family)